MAGPKGGHEVFGSIRRPEETGVESEEFPGENIKSEKYPLAGLLDRAAGARHGVGVAPSKDQPIGIFDSGVGGLTVVRAVLEHLPAERLVYLGDTARVPYGSRSPQTVTRYSLNAARFLMGQGVKLMLIACNTASAAALPALREELPVTVLGAVEPGAGAGVAATRSGVIGVIGTLATLRSGAYPAAIAALTATLPAGRKVRVEGLACPLFVPLVEEGWIAEDDEIAVQVARRYLGELRGRAPDLDTIVLGCTHYPLLSRVLAKVTAELWEHPVRLVDSAQAMAHAAEAALLRLSLLREPRGAAPLSRRAVDRLECFVTDEARVAEIGARFLGRDLGPVELVDL